MKRETMKQAIKIDSNAVDWIPTKTTGVSFKSLRYVRKTGEGCVLIRMEPGTAYPKHRHTKGEEVFVLEGVLVIGKTAYPKGTYIYSPPESVHHPRTEIGCVLLASFPGKVENL